MEERERERERALFKPRDFQKFTLGCYNNLPIFPPSYEIHISTYLKRRYERERSLFKPRDFQNFTFECYENLPIFPPSYEIHVTTYLTYLKRRHERERSLFKPRDFPKFTCLEPDAGCLDKLRKFQTLLDEIKIKKTYAGILERDS